MSGETNLDQLIQNIQPELKDDEFIFASIDKEIFEDSILNPICTFVEEEGISVIIKRDEADKNNILYDSIFKMITLKIHSSLEAVGFLVKISNVLAKHNISINTVSSYYHDYLFIPVSRSLEAMDILNQLNKNIK